MNWHSATVPTERLAALLTTIRGTGGTVTNSQPQADRVRVTWTTPTHSR
jgi:hypothetical protein